VGGRAHATSMVGAPDDYRCVDSWWSDPYEHSLECVGHGRKWDHFVVCGSSGERRLIGFYLQAGSLRAAVGLNRGGDPELDEAGEMAKAGRLIARGARPAPAALVDEDQDLGLL